MLIKEGVKRSRNAVRDSVNACRSTVYEVKWEMGHQRSGKLCDDFGVGQLKEMVGTNPWFLYEKDYTVGQFYWGGIDYLGESWGWPSKGWIRGLTDLVGFRKPLSYYAESTYTDEPVECLDKQITRPSEEPSRKNSNSGDNNEAKRFLKKFNWNDRCFNIGRTCFCSTG